MKAVVGQSVQFFPADGAEPEAAIITKASGDQVDIMVFSAVGSMERVTSIPVIQPKAERPKDKAFCTPLL